MRLCVVDCSFAMAWVFEDERNPLADAILSRLGQRDVIAVPAVLWGLEVRNALRSAVLRRRLTAAGAERRRQLLLALPKVALSCPNGLGDPIDRLVREHSLTSYDAAYLAVSLSFDLPLATADRALAAAAKAVGVPLYAG
jgi:predicted nucleic acid-binding protein